MRVPSSHGGSRRFRSSPAYRKTLVQSRFSGVGFSFLCRVGAAFSCRPMWTISTLREMVGTGKAVPTLPGYSATLFTLSAVFRRPVRRYVKGGSACPSSGGSKPNSHSFRFLPSPLQALQTWPVSRAGIIILARKDSDQIY